MIGIDSYDLYLSFQSTVNTFQGGWFRPQTDFIRKANDISKNMWVKWTREAEKSQEAKDNLQGFLKSKNMIVSNSGVYGSFQPPKDFGRFAAARIIVLNDKCVPCQDVDKGKCSNGDFKSEVEITDDYYNNIEQHDVDLIDDQKWGAVNKHLKKKPTLGSPKMRQIDGGFQVAPRQVSVIVLDYYIEPVEATFIYTKSLGNVQTGSGDELQYDKNNSKPLPWPSTVRNEFIIQLGEAYGVFTRDQFVTQVSMKQKQTA